MLCLPVLDLLEACVFVVVVVFVVFVALGVVVVFVGDVLGCASDSAVF